MTERQIFRLLNSHLTEVQKNFPIENIFGIFITEIQENDITTEAVIIPSLSRICTTLEPLSGYLFDDKIFILDIREVYQATKYGHPEAINALYTDYFIVNPLYQHLFHKLYKSNRDNIKAGIEEGIPAPELKTAIMKVCQCAWNENSNTVKFIKQLTDAEKIALDQIVKLIGDEGTVSQAKAASACGVSRLTMTNLIMKLKFYGIAEIEYLGNKGTFIKFIDDTALNIKGITMERGN